LLYGFNFFFFSFQLLGSIFSFYSIKMHVISKKGNIKSWITIPFKLTPNKYIKQCFAFGEWRSYQFILFPIPKAFRGVMGLQLMWRLNSKVHCRKWTPTSSNQYSLEPQLVGYLLLVILSCQGFITIVNDETLPNFIKTKQWKKGENKEQKERKFMSRLKIVN
jgi:hypothetical protein